MGWAWVFLVHAFVAVLTVFLALRGVRESKDPAARRLDLAGIATLSLAVFCVAYVITQGSKLGFTSPIALAIIAIAVISLSAFIVVEQIAPHPMFDFSVFRVRPFSGALFGSMGMNFSFWPFMTYLPIWLQAGLGLDGLTAELALLAYMLPTLSKSRDTFASSTRQASPFAALADQPVHLFGIGVRCLGGHVRHHHPVFQAGQAFRRRSFERSHWNCALQTH